MSISRSEFMRRMEMMKKEKTKRFWLGSGAMLMTLAFLLFPWVPAEGAGPQVAAGGLHTVGLQPNGTVVAVGNNSDDQINVGSWSDIVAIATGESHTIGLKSNGTVVAIGLNANNQTDVGSMSGIIAIAGGGYHTIGLKSDHTVTALGNNSFGQTVFDSSWTDIVAVTGGLYTTVGLKSLESGGTVVAVGDNTHGQRNVSSWTDIVAVASRYIHTVGLKSDGTVVAVGNNTYLQRNVDSWTDIVAVAAGYYHTVGLKSDGTVVAVGDNTYGQTDVGSWRDIVAVTAGWYHTAGLKSDGTVVAAGGLAPYAYGQTDVGSFFLEADNNFRGAKGTVLTLKGSGFGSRKGLVNVGGIPAKIITWYDSTIMLQVKNALFPGASYPIDIIPGTIGALPVTYGKSFTMKPPELHTVRANQGSAGSVVVLSGRYFGSKKGTVQLGSIFCPVKYWYMDTTNGNSIAVFSIPKTLTPGHYKVTLFCEAGSATFPSAAFTVKAAGAGNAHANHGGEPAEYFPEEQD